MKFCMMLPQYDTNFNTTVTVAQEIERLGFYAGFLYDHFIPYPETNNKKIYECWTVLSSLAMKTQRLKLGSLVTCASYRNPVVLSRIINTLNELSENRVIPGIGAGWYKEEFEYLGFHFLPFYDRVEEVKRTLKVFSHELTTIDEIWLGGQSKKMIKIALSLSASSDIDTVLNVDRCSLELFKKLSKLTQQLKLSTISSVIVGKDENEKQNKLRKYKWKDKTVVEFDSMNIVGTPDECLSKIISYKNMGVDYMVFEFPDLDSFFQFKDEIYPKVKE